MKSSSLASSLVGWIIVATALMALLAAAYHEAPSNGFHFDDGNNIVYHAPARMDEFSWAGLWRAGSEAFLPTRPLTGMSFALDWWRGDGEPGPMLVTNVALHGAAALAIWALVAWVTTKRAGRRRSVWIGALAAAVWMVHPIQVQAVAYVVQRATVLAGLFSVISVYCYLRGRQGGGWRWLLGALAAFALGALCKENAWITPMLWWLAEVGLCRDHESLLRGWKNRLLMAVPIALSAWAVVDLYGGTGPLSAQLLPLYDSRDFTLEERLLTQPRVVFFHLSQVFWPLPGRFSVEHYFPVSTGFLAPPATLIAIAGLGAWVALGVAALLSRAWRDAGFWVLWIPGALAIESSAVPLEMVFEHRMYLPSVGVVGLAASLAARFSWTGLRMGIALGMTGTLIVALASVTGERVRVWRTDLTLYEDAVKHAPLSGRAWLGLGGNLYLAGQPVKAEQALDRALELDPELYRAEEMLGVIHMDRGEMGEAGNRLMRALALRPGDSSVMNHLGEVYLKTGFTLQAAQMFDDAVRARPWVATYRWNLAIALEGLGRCPEALAEWRRYLEFERNEADRRVAAEHMAHGFQNDGRCIAQ